MMTPAGDPRQQAQKRVGTTLNNKYHIDRLIDVGGMAAVYQSTHRNGKRVAIKMLHPFIATNADVRERFLREGYVANQVEHPGAVSILDDDMTQDGAPFLVMELLEGESLDQWMQRTKERLPLADVLAIADQTLDVLSAFHAVNVIHRDIKPGNLFITKSGLVKVLDFGLARLRDPRVSGAPTASGIVLGTASYMPPEQAQGKSDQIDARSDLFAVGAVMFRAITGRPIFEGRTPTDRLFQAMKDRAPSLASIIPEMPQFVTAVVDKALSFKKEDRFASAADMRIAVRSTFAQLRDEAEVRQTVPTTSQVPVDDTSREVSAIFDAIMEPSVIVDLSFQTNGPPKNS
ncbi:MAG: serine/threonine protein kinase [Labilithrix sp.]|nr:serine/threonine protein kinase [Labilithrix sp.]MCW5811859.1 serine/threonine protein kinase [Labilithrix sp.]